MPAGLGGPTRLLRLAGDDRLVAHVRGGDERAFEVLYERHHRAILGFCRHMLGSREEAEDAVQHTFLSAYRDLVANDREVELRPWLFAIARNRCLSILRARREHLALEWAEPSTDGLAATVEQREDLRELLRDVALLPEDQRAALLLAEIGALDHAGIATVLGCPREKVKALVFQARSSLIASRAARATPCAEIRMELATASGGALRRGPLRRHLRTCAGCRAFKAEVATQRKLLALALPVVPGIALKVGVGAAGAGTTGAGAAGGVASGTTAGLLGGTLAPLASIGAAKVAVSLAIAGAIASGGALIAESRHDEAAQPAPAAVAPSSIVPATTAPALVGSRLAGGSNPRTASPRRLGHLLRGNGTYPGHAPPAAHEPGIGVAVGQVGNPPPPPPGRDARPPQAAEGQGPPAQARPPAYSRGGSRGASGQPPYGGAAPPPAAQRPPAAGPPTTPPGNPTPGPSANAPGQPGGVPAPPEQPPRAPPSDPPRGRPPRGPPGA
jgi:RNA polymerase sigma factor (sigma-70 family)